MPSFRNRRRLACFPSRSFQLNNNRDAFDHHHHRFYTHSLALTLLVSGSEQDHAGFIANYKLSNSKSSALWSGSGRDFCVFHHLGDRSKKQTQYTAIYMKQITRRVTIETRTSSQATSMSSVFLRRRLTSD